MKSSILINVAVAAVLGGGYILFDRLGAVRDQTGVGQSAPEFTLPVISEPGGSASLASFKGRPFVLNFWASWCGACKEERPVVRALRERSSAEILGVATSDTEAEARRVEALNPHGYTIALDGAGDVGELYQVRALPTTIVIDANGDVVLRYGRAIRESDIQEISSALSVPGRVAATPSERTGS